MSLNPSSEDLIIEGYIQSLIQKMPVGVGNCFSFFNARIMIWNILRLSRVLQKSNLLEIGEMKHFQGCVGANELD